MSYWGEAPAEPPDNYPVSAKYYSGAPDETPWNKDLHWKRRAKAEKHSRKKDNSNNVKHKYWYYMSPLDHMRMYNAPVIQESLAPTPRSSRCSTCCSCMNGDLSCGSVCEECCASTARSSRSGSASQRSSYPERSRVGNSRRRPASGRPQTSSATSYVGSSSGPIELSQLPGGLQADLHGSVSRLSRPSSASASSSRHRSGKDRRPSSSSGRSRSRSTSRSSHTSRSSRHTYDTYRTQSVSSSKQMSVRQMKQLRKVIDGHAKMMNNVATEKLRELRQDLEEERKWRANADKAVDALAEEVNTIRQDISAVTRPW